MTSDGASDTRPRAYRQARYSLLPNATEIVLVRHGETVPAVDGEPFQLVDGHGDPGLGPEGQLQAEQVADRLADDGPFAALYVTTLRRTVETAAPLAPRLGLEPVVLPELREVLLGEWEGGEFRKHMAEGHPIALEMMRQQRWDLIPGGESNEALEARLKVGIDRIAAAHVGQRVVAFSHGGAIGTILAMACGSHPWAFVGGDNGNISRLVVMEGRWSVRGFNDVSHMR